MSAELGPREVRSGHGAEEAARRGIKSWFREQNQRTSYITVSVAGLRLLATGVLGFWNISLQVGRPELEPIHMLPIAEQGAGWHGTVSWRNGGKQSANSLFMTVYAADKDGRRQDKLWADFCETSRGAVVIPSNPVDCGFNLGVVDHPPDHLLICVAYLNESRKKYRQAFRYRVLPPVLKQTGGSPRRGR